MTKIGPLQLKSAILCDDIRRENNNKFILIGVLSGDVLVNEIPAHIGLAFYLDFEGPIGDYEVELRLSGPGRGSATMMVRMKHETAGTVTVASPRVEVLLEKEGTFRIDGRIKDQKWVSLIKKQIILNPPTGRSDSSAETAPAP